ncbi:MAG TPA: tetratricopeptide repeat-containing glycosyltransferase family protein [Burkholderiaceae bacterium]
MSPLAEQIVALIARSITLQQQGQIQEALGCLDEAQALAPDFPVTLVKRGTLLLAMGRPRAALVDFDRSLARQAVAHVLPLRDAALHAALQELEGDSADPSSCCERALLLERVGRMGDAEARYRQAIELDAHCHAGWIGLGNLLLKMNRHVEALACYEAVLAVTPDDFVALFNRGNALQKDGRHSEALASYATAEVQRPDFAEVRMEQAHCRLALGDWQAGWALFESRWQTRQLQGANLQTAAPQWRGEPLPHGTLLLWAEQGLGDTLQFLRYLPLAAGRAGKIIVRVQPGLASLCDGMSRALPNVTVIAQDAALPAHDAHCPLMSLPLVFGTTPQTIPQNLPYLRVPDGFAEKWKDALGPRRKPRIAIVWCGGQRRLNNPTRDMPLAALLPLLDAIDAEWLSLQKEVSEADAALLAHYPQIRRMEQDLEDFADTAAVLAQTDLLVCVDTAVAHLAGAMGRPVWLVLRKASEWRWLGQDDGVPWYPSLRQFRQLEHGDWQAPVEAMGKVLKEGELSNRNNLFATNG